VSRSGWVWVASLVIAALLSSSAARADSGDPDYLTFGAGAYEIERPNHEAQLRAEYRFGQQFWILKPMVGALVTNDKTFMGYGGFRIDLYLAPHWVLTPNFAFAGYHRGDGFDLGSALEFKSGLELDYRFDDHSRLGVAFDHVSNAGITKINPGANSVLLYYAIPVNWSGYVPKP
jgi:lipid A 3-O-deacylase